MERLRQCGNLFSFPKGRRKPFDRHPIGPVALFPLGNLGARTRRIIERELIPFYVTATIKVGLSPGI